MKKTTRKVNKNPDRKAQRAQANKKSAVKKLEFTKKRDAEVKVLNKMLSDAMTKKKLESDETGEDFNPSEFLSGLLKEAGAKNPHA